MNVAVIPLKRMFKTNKDGYLFSKHGWHDVSEHQKRQLDDEVNKMNGDRLLNTSPDDLRNYLVEKYSIDVPTIDREEIVADQKETEIDVSHDRRRWIEDRSRPFYVTGTRIEITVPFSGDGNVFWIQPTTFSMNPPRGFIKRDHLHLEVSGTELSAQNVKAEINRTLDQIEEYLGRLNKSAELLNAQLPDVADTAIERRREKLLKDRDVVSGLGFKMKPRDGDKAYAAPNVRRKVTPQMPKASSKPYKPEPELTNSDYEHILGVINGMAEVMERSPSAFTSMDEEALRTHFLVQLNGHYDGKATGETFNFEGKTDILIRSDGKNIFIGECKYWAGAKKYSETIDQLLGYSSWRDTKVALIIFNRNKDFSAMIESMNQTTTEHPNFKRELGQQSETSFRYVFAHRDDPNRELIVTAMAFNVPTAE